MGFFKSFGIWQRNNPVLLEPAQGTLVENFSTSTTEFYGSIEAELNAMEVPDLECSRVLYAEGGLLSANREYLRMRRERLIFDVCAAPFGTSYFFSVRFSEIPVVLYIWQLALVLLLLAGLGLAYLWNLGTVWGGIMFGLNVIAAIVLLRNVVALKLHRLDDFLLQLPVFGIVYEVCFRPETYYRTDTRSMYLQTVKRVVQRKIEEVTGQQGIHLVPLDTLQLGELRNAILALRHWVS